MGFDISYKLSPNLHEISQRIFLEKKKTISKCQLLKILPSMLSVNED